MATSSWPLLSLLVVEVVVVSVKVKEVVAMGILIGGVGVAMPSSLLSSLWVITGAVVVVVEGTVLA